MTIHIGISYFCKGIIQLRGILLMNILMIIIGVIILFLRLILPSQASEHKDSPRNSHKSRINSMECKFMCNDITEKMRLTDEQKKSLQTLADELKESRKRAAKELAENKRKVDIALSNSNGRAEAEQLLSKNNETIASLHKSELDIIEKVYAVLDENQKKRLQRMREDRMDEEQENNKTYDSDHSAFFFSHNGNISDNGLPSILPEEESALLGMRNDFFSSFRNGFAFNFNGKDFDKSGTFNFNMPDIEIPDIEMPDIETPDVEAPDIEMDEEEETPRSATPPKAPKSPRFNKQQREKLERSMKNLEKRLKEMEKQIQMEIQSEKKDEI